MASCEGPVIIYGEGLLKRWKVGGRYFRVIRTGAISVFVINKKVLPWSVFSGYARSNKLFVFVWPREIQKTSQKVESCQGSNR